MRFPYKGWFNLRGNKGKRRVDELFSSYKDEAIAIIIVVWIAYIIWEIT